MDRRVWLHGLAGLCTAGLAVMICATGVSPRAGLERWCSDHYSHTGTTVLFLERGMDVYRRPVGAHCQPSPGRRDWRHRQHRRVLSRKWDVNPIDLCLRKTQNGGRSKSRPLVINWQRFPRPYPPGVMLYFLPEALLWDHTGASFHTINRVSIVKLLVVGHLAWMVLVLLLAGLRPRGVAWVVMALGYSQLIYWSLVGIYDGVAILFLLLCLLALQRQRGSLAILALSAACFLHFRALWYLPLLVPGILLVIHKRELRSSLGGHGKNSAGWGRLRIPNPVVLLGAAALFAATAYVFWILWPALKSFPSRNPVDYRKFALESPIFMSYLVPTVGLAMLLAWRRLWLGLGLMVWMTVFFLRTPQIMTWHVLFMLPMLALPALTAPAPSGSQDRRQEHSFFVLVWYFVGAAIVFKATLWPAWIASVVKRLGA
jgi:hypothetical protein